MACRGRSGYDSGMADRQPGGVDIGPPPVRKRPTQDPGQDVRCSAADRELQETYVSMIRVSWARPDSRFRRVFTNMLIPDATEEQLQWVDSLQRMSTSADNAARFRMERLTDDGLAITRS